jgi:hypothetical protein
MSDDKAAELEQLIAENPVLDIPPPDTVPVPQPGPIPTVRPAAVIDEVTPDRGPVLGGTRVTLTGQHLYRVSIVRFGGELAQTIGAREPAELRVVAPARQDAATVDVTIENPGAPMTIKARAFSYAALPAPVIESVAPRELSADKDAKLSVIGKNFVVDSRVLVGEAAPKKVTFVDGGTLEVVVAGGKRGSMMDVAVVNPDGKRVAMKRAFRFS